MATSGHNTWGVHSQHLTACDYASVSSRAEGSAVYQLAHVPTSYPATHDGIVIDECNPSAWLPEESFTVGKLQAATSVVPTGSIADLLLRTVQATLTDATQAKTPLTGRALFDALDQRCNGQLAAWLSALCQEPEVTDPHSLVGRAGYLRLKRPAGGRAPSSWSCRSSGGRSRWSSHVGRRAETGTAACASA